jgi:hypothetical protein
MAISSTGMVPPSGIAPGGRSPLILEEGRALLRLAAPIMLIALVNMGMSVTDTAMVSALLGADALAAVAVGSDLYSILFYLGAGVLGGLAPFCTFGDRALRPGRTGAAGAGSASSRWRCWRRCCKASTPSADPPPPRNRSTRY